MLTVSLVRKAQYVTYMRGVSCHTCCVVDVGEKRLTIRFIALALIKHDCPTFGKGKICEHGVGCID